MVSVTIEPADNGVVKIIYDDSINGAGEEYISRRVYDFESQSKESIVKFLEELTLDLGIDVGSPLEPCVVAIRTEWGDPSAHDQQAIKEKINELKEQLKKLQSYLK
jgi:hypothetical protein